MGRRDENPEDIMDTVNDIKKMLEFYQALGFERLPVSIDTSCKTQVASKKSGNEEYRMRNAGLKPEPRNTKPQIANSALPVPGPALSTQHALSSELKKAALEALRDEIGDCRRCGLAKGRKNIVFGEGSPDAALMFIGEAPGGDEDIQGRPFVGDAGDILMRIIKKMGFKREDVYIGNIVKCRPPSNRDPMEDEIKTCLPFIEKQIAIILPKVIVSLGRIASHTLTGTKIPITKLRGKFSEYKGIPVMPTYHPAYLLRNSDIEERWRVWNDAQKVLELLKEKEG